MPLTLSALNVYPVKGLKGIALTQARCTERGLEHDRRWMVVDPDDNFLSQRELPKMATIWTEIGKGNLTLSAPDMDPLDIPLSPPNSARTQGFSRRSRNSRWAKTSGLTTGRSGPPTANSNPTPPCSAAPTRGTGHHHGSGCR